MKKQIEKQEKIITIIAVSLIVVIVGTLYATLTLSAKGTYAAETCYCTIGSYGYSMCASAGGDWVCTSTSSPTPKPATATPKPATATPKPAATTRKPATTTKAAVSCASYGSASACTAAGCSWNYSTGCTSGGSSVTTTPKPVTTTKAATSCASYGNASACTAAGCSWNYSTGCTSGGSSTATCDEINAQCRSTAATKCANGYTGCTSCAREAYSCKPATTTTKAATSCASYGNASACTAAGCSWNYSTGCTNPGVTPTAVTKNCYFGMCLNGEWKTYSTSLSQANCSGSWGSPPPDPGNCQKPASDDADTDNSKHNLNLENAHDLAVNKNWSCEIRDSSANTYNCVCVGTVQSDGTCNRGGEYIYIPDDETNSGLDQTAADAYASMGYKCTPVTANGKTTFTCTCKKSDGTVVDARGMCMVAHCCCTQAGSCKMYATCSETNGYPWQLRMDQCGNGSANSSTPTKKATTKASSNTPPTGGTPTKTPTPVNACYQCKANETIMEWRNNGTADSKCSSGYNRTNMTQAECKYIAPTIVKACYQCKTDEKIMEWRANGAADSKCSSGYNRTNMTQAECKYEPTVPTNACYQCKNDETIVAWRTNGTADSKCSSGYNRTNMKQSECKYVPAPTTSACYLCKTDETIVAWRANGNADSKCSSGYNRTNMKQSECKYVPLPTGGSCYQCKANSSILKWKSDALGDSSCPGGYKKVTKTQAQCNTGIPDNPPTGTTAIIIAWIIGLSAIGYAYWYFRKTKLS